MTLASCLVAVARTRLRECGLPIPEDFHIVEPELTLYGILRSEPGDAYSRYNGYIRQLISFRQALEQRHATEPHLATE